MQKFLQFVRPFIILTICYIVTTFILKAIEIGIISDLSNISSFNGFICSNIVSCGFVASVCFIIYSLISLLSQKTATFISSLLFAIAIVAEAGLIIYHKSTGILMGNEIIIRPLWETIITIRAFTNFFIIAFTLIFIAVFVFTSTSISKNNINKVITITTLSIMLITIPLFLMVSPNQDKAIVNKLRYCVNSCLENQSNKNKNVEYKSSNISFNEDYINKYKQLYPKREIIDNQFPLERKDNINNVLGTFFQKKDIKPNIVFIIVESLGSDFFRNNEYGYTMTPFLDSLSKHSLLWTNCLSTTPRSAGVIPAVTASVPHGPKGFQFGDIPECNSLFPILKNNGYRSNVFYSSFFSFDRVADYLISQNVDYMSPFYGECNKNKDKNDFDYTSWGYHDKKMFEKSYQVISKRKDNEPNLDMFITISQHDNELNLNSNKALEDYYYKKAEALLRSMPDSESKRLKGRKGFIATFLYGDDAIRDFFYQYTNKYKNTIFVITGDHSLNINSDNPLNAFHVPLIIWSPFIKAPQHFHSVVSHNDITPSLLALLRDNFNIKTPQNVHWISDGLDTTKHFSSKITTYFLMQNNKHNNLLYNDLYYVEDNNRNKLYRIKDNLNMETVYNNDSIKIMKERMDIFKYINDYTYANNCITNNSIIPKKKYELIDSIYVDSIFCASGKEKPSISGVEKFNIFSGKIKSGYSKIKVIFTADIIYTADIDQKDFMSLYIKCTNADWYPDIISKHIVEEDYSPNEYLKLESTKTFDIHNYKKRSKFYFYISPSEHDSCWDPEHSITLKNINIKILGIKENSQ